MPFFHSTGATLETGSIIRPGNWGRVVRLHGWRHDCALREMALEDARGVRFTNRPSRMECAFVCLSEVEGRAYQHANKITSHVLHEVELVEAAAEVFITSWGLVSPVGDLRPGWADAYWDGFPTKVYVAPVICSRACPPVKA